MNIGHAIGNWADNLILKQTIQNSDVTRLAKQIPTKERRAAQEAPPTDNE